MERILRSCVSWVRQMRTNVGEVVKFNLVTFLSLVTNWLSSSSTFLSSLGSDWYSSWFMFFFYHFASDADCDQMTMIISGNQWGDLYNRWYNCRWWRLVPHNPFIYRFHDQYVWTREPWRWFHTSRLSLCLRKLHVSLGSFFFYFTLWLLPDLVLWYERRHGLHWLCSFAYLYPCCRFWYKLYNVLCRMNW